MAVFFGRKLVTQMTDLILGFSKKMLLHLTSLTEAYVRKEINDIEESLNRESFFNLSSEPVSEVLEMLVFSHNLKIVRQCLFYSVNLKNLEQLSLILRNSLK